jgi:hypothetical protein
LELRPLSTGEILDRTFTLYRQHFLFFIGLAAIPRLPTIIGNVFQTQWLAEPEVGIYTTVSVTAVIYVLALVGYLISQGATVLGVSEVYLGRSTTIAESLRLAVNRIGALFGASVLSLLAIAGGFILLFVPGMIAACRLFVCVPAVVIEKQGPLDSFSRSLELTKGYAMRAFLIGLLYFVILAGFSAMVSVPLALSILQNNGNLALMKGWLLAAALLSAALNILLTPVLLIATSVYYYDLRVRKEAFDLHFMMDATPAALPEGQ